MGAVSKVSSAVVAQKPEPKLDNRVWVTTPEQIRFQYQTVGGLLRAVALLLDLFFIALIVSAIGLLLFLLTVILAMVLASAGQFGQDVAATLFGLSIGIYLIVLFVSWWFYGVLQEYRYHGRTWGKMCVGIQVLGVDGRTPTFSQCVWRNFLRLADGLPFFPAIFLYQADSTTLMENAESQSQSLIQAGFALGTLLPTFGTAIAAMMLTARNQRIGDLFAGTMVVQSQTYGAPLVPVFNDVELLTLANQIPRTFTPGRELVETLSLYVSRRQRFTIERRREIASRLAPLFATEFGLSPATDPDLMLGAVYLRAVCDPVQLTNMLEEAMRQTPSYSRSQG
ncbi:MAG: RDD family protein [Pirellulaceae bacterium]|nr:RDD family protein [Pirellulaceae bacterium]